MSHHETLCWVVACALFIVSSALAWYGVSGWGWFLFVAFLMVAV